MPPFWWDVKQLTVLQYTIHEFQVFGPRELLQIYVVKIYLHSQLLAQQQRILTTASRAQQDLETRIYVDNLDRGIRMTSPKK